MLAGEIVDATFMSARALDAFLAEQMADAQAQGVLFSIHLKATMMKVSDPIIFGHAVKTYFADVFAKYGDTFDRIGVEPQRRPRRRAHAASPTLPDAERGRDRGRDRRAAWQDGPRAGHGRLRPRHHQPARAERHHHRRVDAADDPRLRADVERGRRAAGHARPSSPTRRYAGVYDAVIERLPGPRRVRPGHDGLGAQRRAHGAEGRGVRLARQDVRDPRRRHRARRRTAPATRCCRARRSRRATSGAPAR